MYLFCHSLIATVLGLQMVLVVNGRSLIGNVFRATEGASDNISDRTDLDNTTRRPPPPFFDPVIPVHTVYTFVCNTPDFPMIWIIGNIGQPYNFTDKPNQNMTQCYANDDVRGCPLSLIISHKCTGVMDNCTARIEPPDAERDGCEAESFTLRYQCVPAPTLKYPLLPYIVTPVDRKENDPCDAYYQRKNEYSDTASSF